MTASVLLARLGRRPSALAKIFPPTVHCGILFAIKCTPPQCPYRLELRAVRFRLLPFLLAGTFYVALGHAEPPCGDGSCWDGPVQMWGEVVTSPWQSGLGMGRMAVTSKNYRPSLDVTFSDPVSSSIQIPGLVRHLEGIKSRFGYCVNHKAKGTPEQARIFLRMEITAEGTVTGQPEALNHPFGRMFSACLTRSAKSWTLPAGLVKSVTTVTIPIDLRQQKSHPCDCTAATGCGPIHLENRK